MSYESRTDELLDMIDDKLYRIILLLEELVEQQPQQEPQGGQQPPANAPGEQANA